MTEAGTGIGKSDTRFAADFEARAYVIFGMYWIKLGNENVETAENCFRLKSD